jgi:hypothetical protein
MADTPDISAYALDLDLNIATDAASRELARLGSGLDALLSKVHLVTSDAGQISGVFSKAHESIRQYQKTNQLTVQDTKQIREDLEKSYETIDETKDLHDETFKVLEKVAKDREKATDDLTLQSTQIEDIGKHTTAWSKGWTVVKGIAHEVWEEIGMIGMAIGGAIAAIDILEHSFKALAADEERFVTINYRAYGTQRDLVEQVNQTTMSYGLLRDKAMEAYTALAGSLRVPQSELAAYVNETVTFNRVTGISIGTVGMWMRRMRLAGYDLGALRHELRGYEAVMRVAGATTEEVGELMRQQMTTNLAQVGTYGERAARAMREMDVAVGAVVRQYGGSLNILTQFNSGLLTNAQTMIMLRNFGAQYRRELTAQGADLAKLGPITDEQYGKFATLSKAAKLFDIRDPYVQLARFQALSEMTGMSVDQLKNSGMEWKNTLAALKAEGFATEADAISESLRRMQVEQEKASHYQQAMNTIIAQFNEILGFMRSTWEGVAVVLAPIFMRFLAGVGLIAHGVAAMVDGFIAAAKVVGILLAPLIYVYDAVVALSKGLIDGIRAGFAPFLGIINKIFSVLLGQGETWKNFTGVVEKLGYYIGIFLSPALYLASFAMTALGISMTVRVYRGVLSLLTHIPGLTTRILALRTQIVALTTRTYHWVLSMMQSTPMVQRLSRVVIDFATNTLGKLYKGMGSMAVYMVRQARLFATTFISNVRYMGTAAMQFATWIGTNFVSAVARSWGAISQLAGTITGALVSAVGTAWTSVVGFAGVLWEGLVTAVAGAATAIGELAVTIATGFVSAVTTGAVALWGMATAAWAAVAPFLPIIAVVAAVGAAFYGLYKIGAVGAVVRGVGIAFNWVGEQVGWVVGQVGSFFGWVGSLIGKIPGLSQVLGVLMSPLDLIGSAIETVVGWVQSLIGESTLAQTVLGALGTVVSALTAPFDWLGKGIQWVVSWFGANGAGLIEESGWAATALQLLAIPVQAVSDFVTTMGDVVAYVVTKLTDWVTTIPGAGAALSAFAGVAQLAMAPFLAIGKVFHWIGSKLGLISDNSADAQKGIADVQATAVTSQQLQSVEQAQAASDQMHAAIVDPVASAVAELANFVPQLEDIYASIADLISENAEKIRSASNIGGGWLGGLSSFLSDPISSIYAQAHQLRETLSNHDAEPITKIKVLTDGEGSRTDMSSMAKNRHQQQGIELLKAILAAVKVKSGDEDDSKLAELVDLARQYFPRMGDRRLASDLSDWSG